MAKHSTLTQEPHGSAHAREGEKLFGLLAQFDDVDTLLAAASTVRDAGFRRWEAHTPCPIHGLDKAMGHKYTRLPWLVLLCGLTGCATGLLLTWYTNSTSFDGVPYAIRGYLFHISGKPFYSLPAFIPPIFELTILFSAFSSFLGMLAMNRLPRFYHPVFKSARFARATQDRFFISIEAADAQFDRAKTAQLLHDAGASAVEELED
ncbi:MAG: DUF3341 domain-containing protein [Planctomycetes bacterium]|nr:DUF3341 domain-containing protein [Planctomycetota bacterium]